MTAAEAIRIRREFYNNGEPAQQEAAFVEATEYLIYTTHDPRYMTALGGYYYGIRRFDLALKYYELAAGYDDMGAIAGLGYIWYYGRTGAPDYEKAFRYYSKAAKLDDIVCRYKVADMYAQGLYVKQDKAKYRRIIEQLARELRDARSLGEPVPEVFSRLARIRREQGRNREALELLLKAKDFLAQRISYDPFFGNLSIMEGIARDIRELSGDWQEILGLYALPLLLNAPCTVSFTLDGRRCEVCAEEEDGTLYIRFGDKYYRSGSELLEKARVGERLLTAVFDEITELTLEEAE